MDVVVQALPPMAPSEDDDVPRTRNYGGSPFCTLPFTVFWFRESVFLLFLRNIPQAPASKQGDGAASRGEGAEGNVRKTEEVNTCHS